jgi:protocatechuate 3,4-dioxygenase beta subunit
MHKWTTWALGAGILAMTACSGGDKGGSESDDTGAGEGGGSGDGGGGATAFEDFINTTATPVGDFTGFEAGYDAAGAWLSQGAPDPSCVTEVGVDGFVEDFESGNGVPEATVEIWYGDSVDGVPDVTMSSDSAGNVSGGSTMVCQPITYKVSTDPDLDDTKATFEAHTVTAYTSGSANDYYNSVSKSTYQLIPSLLGVSVDPERGTAAGTVYDMNGDPVKGAQVVVRNANDNFPSSVVVKYFVDEFPNREQPETSEDGLWVAVNIDPGDWFIDAYVSDGAGGHILMGRTSVKILADSINIGNIYVGYDGVKYPDNCLAPCGG